MGQRVLGLRWIVVLACLLPLFATARPSAAASELTAQQAQTATIDDAQCFPSTGKCVTGRFLTFWLAHGGVPINGLPLTDERTEVLEDGKPYLVQWFERVRMEYHPENTAPNDVLLGQFGRRLHPADPPVAQKAGYQYFTATGHNIAPDLFAFWDANGGLAQFGYPLSEEFPELQENGKTYTVQYTERARLERHPENSAPNDIQLGQFGRQLLAGGGASPSPAPPSPPSPSIIPPPYPGAQLTIAPQRGPNSTLFVATGVYFAPNATYFLQVISQDGKNQIAFEDPGIRSDKDGNLISRFSFGSAVSAGTYVASVASAANGGQIFASAPFILTGPTGPKPGPFVAVTPVKAKAIERFQLTGTGFAPYTTYTLRVQTEDRQTTLSFEDSRLPTDEDGVIISSFVLPLSSTPGVYIAEVLTKGESPQVLTGTKFTLAALGQTQVVLALSGGAPSPAYTPDLAWDNRRFGAMRPW